MGFQKGNITKLRNKIIALGKVAATKNAAYKKAVLLETKLEQARVTAYRKQDQAINKLNGGQTRWQALSDGRADPTAQELEIIQKDILPSMDAAMNAGDELVKHQTFALSAARTEYRAAKQAYDDAAKFLEKYLNDKEVMKEMPKEDYKAWKQAMTQTIAGL